MTDTWEQEWEAQTGTCGRQKLIKSNTGPRLKVATYNLAEYCMKPSSGAGTKFIWDRPEKVLNLRRWISGTEADLLLSTEDATYLDKAGTKKATPLLWNDRLPSQQGGWVRIRSRYSVTRPKKPDGSALNVVAVNPPKNASKRADGTTGGARYFTFGWLTIEGKTVLVVTVHPRNSCIKYKSNPKVGPVAERMHFLQIVFDLAYCLHDAEIMDGICEGNPWDYAVIGGDFNTSNRNGANTAGKAYNAGTQDYDNLCKLRDYYRFDSANGGYLGWIPTYPSNKECLDNILVSGNVILESITDGSDQFKALYSDHVPLVATMRLGTGDVRLPETTYEGKTKQDLQELRTWLTEIMGGSINRPCIVTKD